MRRIISNLNHMKTFFFFFYENKELFSVKKCPRIVCAAREFRIFCSSITLKSWIEKKKKKREKPGARQNNVHSYVPTQNTPKLSVFFSGFFLKSNNTRHGASKLIFSRLVVVVGQMRNARQLSVLFFFFQTFFL